MSISRVYKLRHVFFDSHNHVNVVFECSLAPFPKLDVLLDEGTFNVDKKLNCRPSKRVAKQAKNGGEEMDRLLKLLTCHFYLDLLTISYLGLRLLNNVYFFQSYLFSHS